MAIMTNGWLNLGGESTATQGVDGARGTFSIQPGISFELRSSSTGRLGLRGDAYLQTDVGGPDTHAAHLSEGVRLGPGFHLGARRRLGLLPFLEGRVSQNLGQAPVTDYPGIHDQNFEIAGGIGGEVSYQTANALGLRLGAHALGGFTSAQVEGDGTSTGPSSDTTVKGVWGGFSLNLNALRRPSITVTFAPGSTPTTPVLASVPAVRPPSVVTSPVEKVRFLTNLGQRDAITNRDVITTSVTAIAAARARIKDATVTVRGTASKTTWPYHSTTSHEWNFNLANQRATTTAALIREGLTAAGVTDITVTVALHTRPSDGFAKANNDFSYDFYGESPQATIRWDVLAEEQIDTTR